MDPLGSSCRNIRQCSKSWKSNSNVVVQNVRRGFDPHDDIFFLNINLVIMYWTLNSIYMQFEYQYPKSSNVDHVQLPREMLRSFVARGMYCLKFGFFVARGIYCFKFV